MNVRTLISLDDLPRRTFTVKDVERMVEVGLMLEDERVELIFGELIPMAAKGNRHEVIKAALLERWFRFTDPVARLIPETTFRLSLDTYLEPDVCVFPRNVPLSRLNGDNALLAVEVSSTSLGYDLGLKARVYAHFGIREVWVIDAVRLVLHVHRDPTPEGYATVSAHASDVTIHPAFAPAAFALRLADLDLGLDADDGDVD